MEDLGFLSGGLCRRNALKFNWTSKLSKILLSQILKITNIALLINHKFNFNYYLNLFIKYLKREWDKGSEKKRGKERETKRERRGGNLNS